MIPLFASLMMSGAGGSALAGGSGLMGSMPIGGQMDVLPNGQPAGGDVGGVSNLGMGRQVPPGQLLPTTYMPLDQAQQFQAPPVQWRPMFGGY